MTRTVTILGATGSIGTSTLDLIERNPEQFRIGAVTAHSNVAELAAIARRTGAATAVIADDALLGELRAALAGADCVAAAGEQALAEAAAGDADLVVAAIVGCAGLKPVMAAVEAGRTIALANKEALVTAGALMIHAARRAGAHILPIDSEHNAIFQCVASSTYEDIERIVLTASGGPFRNWDKAAMDIATPAQAVAHPNWSMGAKISVDSATMMNKGLELIEAHYLFGLPSQRIDIVIHPQSLIHSLVEFVDGSMLAQLGSPDMRIAIAYALAWPKRMATPAERLNLIDVARLDFEAPDETRFPALKLARCALEAGGAAPIVLNAANEVAVERFLAQQLGFADIARIVEQSLATDDSLEPRSIDDVLAIDQAVRVRAATLLGKAQR
ncbi:MAG: 1-deoxy-D-xylulose-5-phosphate reductoisomerase [Sphingomicrobium sp.]